MIYSRNQLAGKALTVLGPVSPDQLGVTLSHEHCLLDITCTHVEPKEATLRKLAKEPVTLKNAGILRYRSNDNLDNSLLLDEALSLAEIAPFKYAGGKTIIDMTNIGLARDPSAIRRISMATGLNIVMGSGYYVKKAQPAELVEKLTEEAIAEEIAGDILKGVNGTDIHSGLIGEIGCSWPLEDFERKVLRASARAQKETGAPLVIHPGRHEDAPLEILQILKEAGADLGHTVMSHVERTLFEAENRYAIARSGCYLAYDLFGNEGYYPETLSITDIPNDAGRIAQIKDLMAKGFGRQILISHDICKKTRYMAFGGHGYTHILNNAVPAMRLRGMKDEQIDDLLVGNPRQAFVFKG